jgi:ring-1,2-phenylacetyl-CoA epoxidase subunit PaaD
MARDDEDEVGDARCPHCGSRDVERFSRFGSEVSSQQYECQACGSPFERIRFDGEQPDTRRDGED